MSPLYPDALDRLPTSSLGHEKIARPAAGTVLAARDLVVRFGGVVALDGVSLSLGTGGFVGLIGPNGAGKTTFLRALTGVVRPQSGRVWLAGAEITRLSIARRVQRGLGLSQQLVRPLRRKSVLENVALAAGHRRTRLPWVALGRRDRKAELERARKLLELVGIDWAARNLPEALPLGMLKRLEMARALALDPKVLLLDEPLAGLNHVEAGRLADLIRSLNESGLAIVLIEHNLAEVVRVCRRLVVLDNGRVIADGPTVEVMDDPAVRAAYLGREAPRADA